MQQLVPLPCKSKATFMICRRMTSVHVPADYSYIEPIYMCEYIWYTCTARLLHCLPRQLDQVLQHVYLYLCVQVHT